MTIEQVTKLIVDAQSSLARRKQTALARGQWIKAFECDVASTAMEQIRQEVMQREVADQLKTVAEGSEG